MDCRMDDVMIVSYSVNFEKEDFESLASSVKTKIQTYFSQLIEVIKQRQSKLTSELDEIISHYRLERDKIKELEEMKKYHEELYTNSTFKELQDDILSRIKTEITEMKERTKGKMVLDFEWNQKYARDANELGKLNSSDVINTPKNTPVINNVFAPSLDFKATKPLDKPSMSSLSSPNKNFPLNVRIGGSQSKSYSIPPPSHKIIGLQAKKIDKALLTAQRMKRKSEVDFADILLVQRTDPSKKSKSFSGDTF